MWTFITRSFILLVLVDNITSLSFVQEHSRGFEFPSDPARNPDDVLARQSLVGNSFGGTPALTLGLTGQFPAGVGFANPYPMPQTALIVNNSTVGACICVTTGSCALAGGGTTPGGSSDGAGLIDVRIISNGVTTPAASTGTPLAVTTAVSSGITPAVISPTFCQAGLERCCPTAGFSCGIRYPSMAGSRAPLAGQSAYGAYPWQAVILAPGDVYQGSGALLDHLHVLTAAHKVNDFVTNGRPLKIRVGEWDASASTEPVPAQEYQVARIFIHPSYTASNLKNSIAILRLSTAIPLGQTPTITNACLPSNSITNVRCWVSGWGKNDFSTAGAYQAIQKEVDVPIVAQATCQQQLQSTRLGLNFLLDNTSFMCAGGEAGKDACTGDGGSPLMCQVSGRWFVAGLVAWGIGCGTNNVPGVYINVANYIPWIQQVTRS